MSSKNTICLWYDKDAEEAARFYAATFRDSQVTAVHVAPGDYPSGKKGDVLTVEFTVAGVSCLGLNGGPNFKHSEAFSFQIMTEDQEEPTATGMQSPEMAGSKVNAAGAKTAGVSPGRSHLGCSRKHSLPVAQNQNAFSRP